MLRRIERGVDRPIECGLEHVACRRTEAERIGRIGEKTLIGERVDDDLLRPVIGVCKDEPDTQTATSFTPPTLTGPVRSGVYAARYRLSNTGAQRTSVSFG